MKTKIGMMLMGLAVLASCTNENGTTDDNGIIRLGVANETTVTRGMINDLADLSASGNNVGIYGVATANTDANQLVTSDWTATPLMKNIATTGIETASGLMEWANPENYVYPKSSDAKKNVKFFAYYPQSASSISEPAASTAPVLSFTLTGEEDLMWATPVLGSRTQPASTLKFNHKLTQLSFRLVDSEGKFTSPITSVKISANSVGKMNIETGVLSEWGTEKEFTLTTTDITMPTDGSYVTLPKTVMLQPEQTEFAMKLNAGGEKPATIKPMGDTTFKAGKAYMITLRLSGNVPVQLGAEIVPWETGGTGEGVVE